FTDHECYTAVSCLREISELAGLLAHSHNHRVLRQRDANIYTHMQNALRGKSKIHRRSILAGVENIFFGCKAVLSSINNLRGAPAGHCGTITSLIGKMSALLIYLELQLMEPSGEKSSALRNELIKEGAAVRRAISTARLEALCVPDTGPESSNVHNFTTALADIEKWLQAVEAMSALAVRRYSRRTIAG
ncbi:MAG: hypothetical protein Q8O90_05585, partial [Elusimicrobiota bacterium]|nr:hypothetical protein [Elusimicrobiota bacterium]